MASGSSLLSGFYPAVDNSLIKNNLKIKQMKKILSVLAVGSLAALTLMVLAQPADASGGRRGGSSDITINNDSSADVTNTVIVTASTGGNTANGGDGEDGGRGGDAIGPSSSRWGHHGSSGSNTGGDGGNGGDGGTGGSIDTGDAAASAVITNDVNSTSNRVTSDCGCGSRHGSNDINLDTRSRATLVNLADVLADTGLNTTNGGTADDGGRGGDASGRGTNTGGDAGNGGDGADGGSITTGDSFAGAEVVNVVGRTVNRVRR